jgi:peroxiredoxin
MIQVGDTLPDVQLWEMGEQRPQAISSGELFAGKRVLLFALPGAYTPTCSAAHLPGYVVKSDEIHAKGIDDIICLSVNDGFVMHAWGEANNATGVVRMIGDGNGEFTAAIGLELDATGGGMGMRSKRYAMLVEDNVVKHIAVEEPGKFEVSSAEAMLATL